MESGITVRDLRPGDRDAWRPLWDGYNAFYGRHGATALPEPIVATTWDRLNDPDEPVHGLVAELDGRVVGFTHYLFHRTTIGIADTCYLQDLFTAEAARGRGAARALIAAVARRAHEAGSARVYWHTHESNATARGLYDQVAQLTGFIVYRIDV